MVIGNGLVAQAFSHFKENDLICVYASGVSDSQEVSQYEFDREKELLTKYLVSESSKVFVYFSTTSLLNKEENNTVYYLHKQKMEELIKDRSKNYLIFRLSQIVGQGGNPTNIVNYIYNNIVSEKTFHIHKYATRNLIDIEYVRKVVDYVLLEMDKYNTTINIASPKNISVINIVKIIESITGKKSKLNYVDLGNDQVIDISFLEKIYHNLDLEMDCNQPDSMIRKYFDIV